MGCCYSRLDNQEMVSRCRARKRHMKQFVEARHAFSASHAMYLRSLRTTGSALLHFATNETTLHHPQHQHQHQHCHHLPPTLASPPPPISPTSQSWTTSTTNTASTPLPPPPPPPSSTWDFWDPFMPSSTRSATVDDEEWEDMSTSIALDTAVTTTIGAATVVAPPSVVGGISSSTATTSEMAVVVSIKSKDLVEIIRELDVYFLQAADSGGKLSALLEVPACTLPGHMQISSGNVTAGSHCSTVERLYAWEKKLYQDVKDVESLKMAHAKRAKQLRKMELKRSDYMKMDKAKKDVEKLESLIMVSSQAIGSTSDEIIKLREEELYPQIVELVKGLKGMWRSLYESHQVQMHIVQQLKYLHVLPSTDPTSEIHRQAVLQLELEVQQWHLSFCRLIKSQRDYVQSLTGWLRLSLFPLTQPKQASAAYTLCEEWHLLIDNAPDEVASEGIKAFLTGVHAIAVQQAEEQKQKKRSESLFKKLEKKTGELRALERKFGPTFSGGKDVVGEKRAKVERLRSKTEEERSRYEKSIGVTRAMTLGNLQIGLPHVFQAVTGFANVWAQAFESVYNHAKSKTSPEPEEEANDVKRLMF